MIRKNNVTLQRMKYEFYGETCPNCKKIIDYIKGLK